jgi:uncharacterized protein (TIGR03067 family)
MNSRSLLVSFAIAIVFFGPVAFFSRAEDEAAKELQRFQGKWREGQTDFFQDGNALNFAKVPASPPVFDIKDSKFIYPSDKEGLPFRIDPAKEPKQIRLTLRHQLADGTFELKEHLGIYTLEGDQLRICMLSKGSTEKAPKAFPERGKPVEEDVSVTAYERVKD